jgi:GTP-binding protein
LGHDFLRHIERTRMLVHVVDISGSEGRDPLEDFAKINRELEQYGDLKDRPMIVCANKMDLEGAAENLARLKDRLAGTETEIYPVAAAVGGDFNPLVYAIIRILDALPPVEPFREEELYDLESDSGETFVIDLTDGVYVVSGRGVDYLVRSVNFGDEDSLNYFHRTLRRWGVIEALRERGAKEGDLVRIENMEFDFID